MFLEEILTKYCFEATFGPLHERKSTEITDITLDSRTVEPSFLFFLPPQASKSQTLEWMESAIQRGAAAAVCHDFNVCQSLSNRYPKAILLAPAESGIYEFRTKLIQEFYPGGPKFVSAVTGTNGKTSTVGFTRQLLGLIGKKAGSLGTLGVGIENCAGFKSSDFPPHPFPPLTTIQPLDFHKCSSALANFAGVEYLALEASSEGMLDHRLDGVRFDVGIFTNFTQDHLDYHGSMEKYFEAKTILFSKLMKSNGVALINNSLSAEVKNRLNSICKQNQIKVWDYGRDSGTLHYKLGPARLSIFDQEYILPESLQTWPGFQIENILAAIGSLLAFELPLKEIMAALGVLQPIPGRSEWVGTSSTGGNIFVDYAHTPDALESILRSHAGSIAATQNQKISVVFGCGGNRDKKKRAEMGQIAAQLAYNIFVTDDNPRNEDPISIRKNILEGCPRTANIAEVGDRREAIRQGIQSLGQGDVLIIAGKGAETVQIIGDIEIPFNDAQVVKEILAM